MKAIMRNFSIMFALFRRECLSLLVSPATYVAITLFVLITSLGFYLTVNNTSQAAFEPVAVFVEFLAIFFVPLLTMKLFAEEKRLGTLELLFTAPVEPWQAVAAKFAAGYVFYLVMISPCAVYVGMLMSVGDIDGGVVTTCGIGLLLTGLLYVSVGLFTSSLTRSQIAAAIGGMAILFFFWAVWYLGDDASLWGRAVRYISIKRHFDLSLVLGVLDAGDPVFYITASLGFLFLTWAIFESGGGAHGIPAAISRRRLLFSAILVLFAVEALLFGIAKIHIDQLTLEQFRELWHTRGFAGVFNNILPFAISVLCVLVCMLVLRGGIARRIYAALSRRGGLRLAGGILCVGVILANLNAFTSMNSWRSDWSEKSLNTLDQTTIKTLESLQDSVAITVFYSDNERMYDNFPVKEKVVRLLTEFTACTPRVKVQYLDPNVAPSRCREIAEEKELKFSRLNEIALMEYAGRRTFIPWDRVAEERVNMLGRTYRVFNGETIFASSIRRLLDPRHPVVYFTEGHSEYDSYSLKEEPMRMGMFAKMLAEDGFRVNRLKLPSAEGIPEDCEVLIIAGPNQPFAPGDVAAIQAYVRRGGKVFMLVDPPPIKLPMGIEKMFSEWGMELKDDIVFDPKSGAGGESGIIRGRVNPEHPISGGSRGFGCELRHTRSIMLTAPKYGVTVGRVVETRPEARAVDIDVYRSKDTSKGTILEGQQVCIASAEDKTGPLIVLSGDADIVGNLSFTQTPNNRPLASSIVSWLVGRNYVVGISEREDIDRKITLSAYETRIFFWVSLVALPQLFLAAGLLIWWLRRN